MRGRFVPRGRQFVRKCSDDQHGHAIAKAVDEFFAERHSIAIGELDIDDGYPELDGSYLHPATPVRTDGMRSAYPLLDVETW